MDEQLNAFLAYLQAEKHYSPNTLVAYRNDLGQLTHFLQQFPGVEIWDDADEVMIDTYVRTMKQGDYASSSVARKVAAMKSFFHFMYDHETISLDPTTNIDSPKVKKRLPKTLTFDDVDRLLHAPRQKKTPKNLRDSALLALLYATGMRVTELVSLKMADVNLSEGWLICPGKEGDTRALPIDEETQMILQAYLDSGRPHLVKDRAEKSLFLNHRGQQLTRQGLWLIIKTYARQVRLSAAVTPHTLRHSFAAHKLKNGTGLGEIQQLLGHANISTTQIYTQLTPQPEGV
ncbi:MAG: tyrosine recombinase [Chloroflexi bacterium]|nr:tyrosine recombinase [Chloroflexota bacterium]MBP8056067.1 tyrosine recombinase [Chloroflexota bacterium]